MKNFVRKMARQIRIIASRSIHNQWEFRRAFTIPVLITLLNVCFFNSSRADSIYVGNWGNNTIEKFDSITGIGTLFANSGLSQPQGLALDNQGNLFVGNSGNNTIMKFDSAGHGSFFGNSGSPAGLAFDGACNLFAVYEAGSR